MQFPSQVFFPFFLAGEVCEILSQNRGINPKRRPSHLSRGQWDLGGLGARISTLKRIDRFDLKKREKDLVGELHEQRREVNKIWASFKDKSRSNYENVDNYNVLKTVVIFGFNFVCRTILLTRESPGNTEIGRPNTLPVNTGRADHQIPYLTCNFTGR